MINYKYRVTIQGRKEEAVMKRNEETIVTVLALVALVLVTVGISYAAFTYIGQGQRENTIQTGNLTFVYDESNKSGNGISIDNATPTNDELGKASVKQGEVFEFSVSASTKGAPIYYEIYTTKQNDSTLPERIIKTYLTNVQGTEEVEVLDTLNNQAINFYNKLGISQIPNQENGRTLYQEMIPEGQDNYSKTFKYRMWIREDATETNERGVWKYSNKSFTVKVNVYASNNPIGEPIKSEQEPNEPVLVQGQIPVIYNKEQKTWVKADIGTNWYDYSNQEWANAVTVKETGTKTREEYMSAEVATPISMDDINTMWVWIPRYEYMYTNLGTNYAGGTKEQPGEIKVNFIEGTRKTPSDSNNYKVHPAFTFGPREMSGFWYGKFETGGTLSRACSDLNCNVKAITVKPGVIALTEQTVSSFFYMARSMQLNNASTYGFSKTGSDLHMSKNSEWGSVAYLSQSRYGKYGNPNYKGANKEVYQNKSSDFITGMSNGTPSTDVTNTQSTYDVEEKGTGASTTGNITGVYDMSGGTWEYVMGVRTDSNGNPESGYSTNNNSGFNGYLGYSKVYKTDGLPIPSSDHYLNLYPSSCTDDACYGHALNETSGWYGNNDGYVIDTHPWFIRGATYRHSNAGVFSYYYYGGNATTSTTRLSHVPFK